ncbi:MAG: ATP synthase F1 subunit delta [Verrucomicrobia bacterium]|nr:ATP synthase F1 subunit delta [Verrucomicrobiota bacterium]MCH8511998.1 ATP synthase F1 subunit delta [Kiritimatiellia bacterium]
MSAVAKRYTPALFSAAREADALDRVYEDAQALSALLDSSPEFASFLSHPLIPAVKRDEVLTALFKGKLHEVTLVFLRLLARKERLRDLPDILLEIERSMDEERGIVNVSLRSAEKFLAKQETDLNQKLADRLGKSIRLHSEVDESLIGGFLIQMGDRIEDYSLAAKLKTFKQNVINA